ncbi:MAG: MoxR family ATPase [Candidatus Brocadiia bacterium]|jgi:MoxR-like ATPase|nr:MoxR family ATPase [Candidatus Brocadiia bacterium]
MEEQREELQAEVERAGALLGRLRAEVHRVLVGQEALLDGLLTAMLCGGHALVEGVPGLAKTMCATALAACIEARVHRVQFTPDLLPGDLVGSEVFSPASGEFSMRKGPVFAHILLADEINRAPAKVQSALLEAMQERQVTIGGRSLPLPDPFLVIATQNPIEHEGTYPLPEAQVDRFLLKLCVDYPGGDEELEIVDRMAFSRPNIALRPVLKPEEVLLMRGLADRLRVDGRIKQYALEIVQRTRPPRRAELGLDHLIEWGASPRATIYLVMAARAHALMAGRHYVIPDDVKAVCPDVLRHRLILTFEAEAEAVSPEDIIERILADVAVP